MSLGRRSLGSGPELLDLPILVVRNPSDTLHFPYFGKTCILQP